MASTHVSLVTAGGTANRRIASSLYGYCTSGAGTVGKSVSLYTGNSTTADGTWTAGDLFHGLTITVRFQYSNTAANPTLNVNGTGAKQIYKYGTTSPGNTASTSWQANSVISLTYDTLLNASGCWVMNDHLDDTTGGSGSVEYTLSGSGDDDEYTITATPTVGTPTSATIPAATTTAAGVMSAADKSKLDGIASGAEVNVQSDWSQTDSTADDYIKNKPTFADWVTSTGSSGNWKWRIWNSGLKEVEGKYDGTPATGKHYATVGGLYGYRVDSFSIPTAARFTNTDYKVVANWTIGSGFAMDAGTVSSRTTSGFNLYALASASNQTTVHIHFYCIGH